jgi:hypothetical protein
VPLHRPSAGGGASGRNPSPEIHSHGESNTSVPGTSIPTECARLLRSSTVPRESSPASLSGTQNAQHNLYTSEMSW